MQEKLGGLTLTRRVGESIMIGDDIEILVTQAKARTARITIIAPKHIEVNRKEVWNFIKKRDGGEKRV